jgi:hypothetical protein
MADPSQFTHLEARAQIVVHELAAGAAAGEPDPAEYALKKAQLVVLKVAIY